MPFGSALICGVIGYLVFRQRGFFTTVGAALLVGIVDATLGWYISWEIGSGMFLAEQATIPEMVITILIILVLTVIYAAIGSAIAK